MSFDPGMVEAVRAIAPGLPRGIVAERHYTHPDGPHALRWPNATWLTAAPPATRPHFLAYAVRDLPAAAPLLAQRIFGLPLLPGLCASEDHASAARYAGQIIFEGIRPAQERRSTERLTAGIPLSGRRDRPVEAR